MGLSDREKKIIEEMEAALQAEDPRLVATMERSRPSMVYNFAAIIIGLALLLSGVITNFVFIGIIGFIIALAGAATIRVAPRANGSKGVKVKGSNGPGKMQERWNRRNNQQ